MKKLVLSMAVVAAATMVSCGNKAENAAADAADSTNAVVEGVVVDETVVVTEDEAPSLLDNIKSAASAENVQKGIAYVKQLVASGKLAEARTYLDQIKPYADKVGMTGALETVSTALEKAEGVAGNVAGDVKEKAEAAVDGVKEDAAAAVDAAKQKAQEAGAAVSEGVQNGVNAAKNLLK